jgi:DNA-binding HxlR family transcriptional regulator
MNRMEFVTEVIDTVARKWTVEIAEKLEGGPRRYNELLKDLDNQITPKVFTRALRRMEADNIVEREMIAGSPPRVEYTLTIFGRSLLAALDELAHVWSLRR